MRRTTLAVLAVVAMMGLMAGCDPAPAPSPPPPVAHPAGQYPAKFSFQLVPGEPNGAVIGGVQILNHNNTTDPTLCVDNYVMPDGSAGYLCHVVKGLRPWSTEGPWTFPYNTAVAFAQRAQDGDPCGHYGCRVQRAGANATYEGCQQVGAFGATWSCDYHVFGEVLRPHNPLAGWWGWAVMNTWDWTKYAVNTLACAGDIAAGWYFAPVTIVKINDCLAGPWIK